MKTDPEAKGPRDSENLIADKKSRPSRSNSSDSATWQKRIQPFELQFADLLEKISEGFVALDPQMNYVYINKVGSDLLNRTSEDLIGRNYWEDYPQDKDTVFGQAYLRALETQTPIELEEYYAPRGRWFRNHIYPSEYGLSIFFSDVTERKRGEQVLTNYTRQQEALYQLTDQLHHTQALEDVFDAALTAILHALQCDRASILLFDESGLMHFVAWHGLSDEYRTATDGHSPWQPDVKNPEPIYMGDPATAQLSDSLKTVIKAEGISSLAFVPLVSGGRLIGKFMIYFNLPHLFSESERDLSLTIAHQLAFGIDRQRAEARLRASEERFRNLSNVVPSMIWTAAPDGTILYANDQWYEYTGISPEENSRHWPIVLHPDDFERCTSEWKHALETVPDEYLIEVRNRRHDGQYRWFQTRAIPVRDSHGQATAWYGVTTDIHNRIETEQRLILLSEISELVRKLEDPNELLFAISKAVGEHLQVRRCFFNEIDVDNDLEIVRQDYCREVESVAGVHKVSEYSSVTSAEIASGKTIVNRDSKTDPRTASDYERSYVAHGERAYVAVPLMREKRWVATLWVSDDKPRDWSQAEVSLLETIAERTWTVIEKLRINTALRASEERYRFIVENTSDGIWQIELTEPMPLSLPREEQIDWYYRHATIHECNLGLARMYGYTSVHEVIGLPLRILMPRENPANLELSWKFMNSSYRLVDAESREVGRDGQEKIFLNNMVGVIDDGRLIGEWGTNRDITDRKQAEEALRESRERYRNLFNFVPVAVYTCDASGLIQEFNQRALELWGREPKKNDPEERYCGSFRIFYPDGRVMPHERCPMARILNGETLASHELEILIERPDGVRKHVIAHPLLLINEHGKIIEAINCLYDITERKQAEEGLHQLNLELESRVEQRTAQLQAANQALDESHRRLQNLSQRLVEVQEDERRAIARELHDRVGQNLAALNLNLTIINNQLAILVNDQVKARLSDSMGLVAELIVLVRDVMSNLRPAVLDDYGLEAALHMTVAQYKSRYGIAIHFEKNLSPIPHLGSSVEMTLLRIAQEALLNVVRHAQAEQVKLTVRLEANLIRLTVQDNGIGIHSWQNANRPGSHGLTIMRERAEAVGGNLKVSSTPGKGTQVEASIPVHDNNLKEPEQ